MNLVIRDLIKEDIQVCAHIMCTTPLWQRYHVTYDKALARFRSGLNSGCNILVAELAGIVVGFIWYLSKGAFNRSGYIMLIGIDQSNRHSGIGGLLLKTAEDQLFQHSDDVFLLVSDFNNSAQDFYIKHGYAQCGSIGDYVVPGITELIFHKRKPQ